MSDIQQFLRDMCILTWDQRDSQLVMMQEVDHYIQPKGLAEKALVWGFRKSEEEKTCEWLYLDT